jgi:flagellar motor component MotA
MNQHDRKQLNYIMSLSNEAFDEWAQSIPMKDIQYAVELIQAARTESMIQEQQLLDALEDSDLAEANAVLKKFQL